MKEANWVWNYWVRSNLSLGSTQMLHYIQVDVLVSDTAHNVYYGLVYKESFRPTVYSIHILKLNLWLPKWAKCPTFLPVHSTMSWFVYLHPASRAVCSAMRSTLCMSEVWESLGTDLPWWFTGSLSAVHVHPVPQAISTHTLPASHTHVLHNSRLVPW